MRRRLRVLLWVAVAGVLACGQAPAEEDVPIAVRRTVDFTSVGWDDDDTGRLTIEAFLQPSGGSLRGIARVELDWTWPHPPCERPAGFRGVAGVGPVEAVIADGRLVMDVVVPVAGSYTSLLGSFLGIHVCLSQPVGFTYDAAVMEWGRFDLPLAQGRHDGTRAWSSTEGGTILLEGLVHTTVVPASAEAEGVLAALPAPDAPLDWEVHPGFGPAAPAEAAAGGDGRPRLAPFLRDAVMPPR